MSQQMKMELFKRLYSQSGRSLVPTEFQELVNKLKEVS